MALSLFCHTCLWSIRAVRNNWELTSTSFHCGAAAKIPQEVGIWEIEHPNREVLLLEIESGLRFLGRHKDIFAGQPWEWLIDFLTAVESELRL